MKKDFLLFVGLILGGAGLYFFFRNRPAGPANVTTTGTARTDPGILTAFAQLFGKGGTSSIAVPRDNGGTAASISAAVGPLAQLAAQALGKVLGSGQSKTSAEPIQAWPSYPATPLDAYNDANAYNAAVGSAYGGPYADTFGNTASSGSYGNYGPDPVQESYDEAFADQWGLGLGTDFSGSAIAA